MVPLGYTGRCARALCRGNQVSPADTPRVLVPEYDRVSCWYVTLELTRGSPGWPWTHGDPPASTLTASFYKCEPPCLSSQNCVFCLSSQRWRTTYRQKDRKGFSGLTLSCQMNTFLEGSLGIWEWWKLLPLALQWQMMCRHFLLGPALYWFLLILGRPSGNDTVLTGGLLCVMHYLDLQVSPSSLFQFKWKLANFRESIYIQQNLLKYFFVFHSLIW